MNWNDLPEVLDDHLGGWYVASADPELTFSEFITKRVRDWVEEQMTEESTSYPPYHTTLYRRLVTDWAEVAE